MNVRKITLEELPALHFAGEEVLSSFEEKFEREHKLKTAMALTNSDHESISLFVRLATGEVVEIVSDLIDLEEDFVELRGGHGIPLRAILDVGV
jgi:hypothetical protein